MATEEKEADSARVIIPQYVIKCADRYAQDKGTDRTHPAERPRAASDIFADSICCWAVSKWLTSLNIWHETTYVDDCDSDIMLECHEGIKGYGVCAEWLNPGNITNRITKGLGISHYRTQIEDVGGWIACGYWNSAVTIYGIVPKGTDFTGWELLPNFTPLMYNYPARQAWAVIDAACIERIAARTKEPQEIFGGLFVEGEVA